MRVFNAIVVGLDAMGSTCHLVQDGKKVLGLKMFPTAKDKGLSHRASRVICEVDVRVRSIWRKGESNETRNGGSRTHS